MSNTSSVETSVESEGNMSGVQPGRTVRSAEGLLERNVGGQTFVLTPDSQLHILENATARHLWACISEAGDGGISESDLVASLIEKFEVDHAIASTDVSSYLDHLLEVDVFEIMP